MREMVQCSKCKRTRLHEFGFWADAEARRRGVDPHACPYCGYKPGPAGLGLLIFLIIAAGVVSLAKSCFGA